MKMTIHLYIVSWLWIHLAIPTPSLWMKRRQNCIAWRQETWRERNSIWGTYMHDNKRKSEYGGKYFCGYMFFFFAIWQFLQNKTFLKFQQILMSSTSSCGPALTKISRHMSASTPSFLMPYIKPLTSLCKMSVNFYATTLSKLPQW